MARPPRDAPMPRPATRPVPQGPGVRRCRQGSATDGPLELGLVHLRPALDALVLGLVVELVAGATAGTLVGPEPAAPARRDVIGRRAARLLRLAGPCPLLVDRAGGDLLGSVLAL